MEFRSGRSTSRHRLAIASTSYGVMLAVLCCISPRVTPGQSPSPPKKPSLPATEPVEPQANSESIEAAAELEKERVAAERFLAVLEKNPRRGTALDKVYSFHVERGTLNAWVQKYRDRVQQQGEDGLAWMSLGLIELQRGQDAAAVTAFQSAEKFLPDNALASYYLGQSLILVGQPDPAAEALERALKRKPAQVDQLEIFQALGCVYQRAQQTDKALVVWKRLEELFPNDWRVQEQIAQTLVEEGQPALALPRFEALAGKATKDLYRQSQFRIQAAELKVQLNQTPLALADFEKLLNELNPDNWLYRDVRQKIEAVYLRNDDQAGLAAYYQGWLEKHPDDVDAMARVARILAGQGRIPESQVWLEKGLKLAPTRQELRKVIIDQLVYDQNYAEAIKQYELLNKQVPNNPDTIREWGRLILKDNSKPLPERQQAATALWKQLLIAKPKDSVVVTQVADLFRQSELTDEALKLYRQAVDLAPESPQYREYLGEYYHQLKRPAEALATWQEIAGGKSRTAENLSRLGEVLSGFGYLAESTTAYLEAVEVDPQNFDLKLRLAKVLHRREQYDEALAQLVAAEKLVTNAEEGEAVLQQKLLNYQAAGTLAAEIQTLTQELAAANADPKLATKWFLLARYCEADRQVAEAEKAVQKALELDPQSIPILAASARLQEANRNLGEAAESNRKLAAIDRRFRSEYLTKVAKLEAQLGRVDAALKAGREVLAAAPNNPDGYEFYSQLCFQLGSNEEGLETLRRAVRVNPSDIRTLNSLAGKLAEQFKTPEAIEFYWRAFDKSPEIDSKLEAITELTDLYLTTNHFDKLLERLERQRRADPQQMRAATLCIAQAHQEAGDTSAARRELESLLTTDTRDTSLLQQLAKLGANEGDFATAVKYQRQLNQIAPGRDNSVQLANYLSQNDQATEAGELLVQVVLAEKDAETILKNLDTLLGQGQHVRVASITERLLRNDPKNWELLYREGVALFRKQPAQAEERFRRILALTVSDDELGVLEKAKQKRLATQKVTPGTSRTTDPLLLREQLRTSNVDELIESAGISQQYSRSNSTWAPATFGNARMGAYVWLLSRAQSTGQEEDFWKKQRAAWEQATTSPRAAWDWYYLQLVNQEAWEESSSAQVEITRSLVNQPRPTADATLLFLKALENREVQLSPVAVAQADGKGPQKKQLPLSDVDLQLMLTQYQRTQIDPEFAGTMQSGTGIDLLRTVRRELKIAERMPKANQLLDQALKHATNPAQLVALMGVVANDANPEQVLKLWDRLDQLPTSTLHAAAQNILAELGSSTLPTLMMQFAEAKKYAELNTILDRFLLQAGRQQRRAAKSGKLQNSNASNPHGFKHPFYYIQANGSQGRIAFPQPNSHFDYHSIVMLRNAHVLYQKAHLVPELIAHIKQQANKPDAGEDLITWQFSLAYLHWLNNSHELALAELEGIVKSQPEDFELRLELAELYSGRNNFAKSLEILTAASPVEADLLRRSETQILRVATRVGDTARAREAAKRLFGMRLDMDAQIQLAGQMRRLGLNEEADAIMARAQKHAGNRIDSLVTLMQESQSQETPEQAVQLAHTIVRRTHPRGVKSRSQGRTESDVARRQALEVLSEAGHLKELIERTELQLKNAPNSVSVHQTLADYYTAAGETAKAKELTTKLAELNYHSPQVRWELAMELLETGKSDNAIEQFKTAMQEDPQLLDDHYWEVQQAFQKHKKLPELVKLFEGVELRSVGQSYVFTYMLQLMTQDPEAQKPALELLKRLWVVFPKERQGLLGSISGEDIWEAPELYDLALQEFIPTASQIKATPWVGLSGYTTSGGEQWFGSSGNLTFGMDRNVPAGAAQVSQRYQYILRAAKSQKRLEDFDQTVGQLIEKHPDWLAGPALRALLLAKRDQPEGTLKYFEQLLPKKDSEIPRKTAWLIGQELALIPNGNTLAIHYYEYANSKDAEERNSQFSWSPASGLADLYLKSGDKDKARKLLLTAARVNVEVDEDDEEEVSNQVQNRINIAAKFQKLGYPLDALQVYNKILRDSKSLETAVNYSNSYGDDENFSQAARQGFEKALSGIKAVTNASEIQSLLRPETGKVIDPRVFAIELHLGPGSSKAKLPRMESLLAQILDKAVKSAEIRAELITGLQKLQTERPEDLSVLIAIGLLAAGDSQPATLQHAAEQLDQWLTAHPLATATPQKPTDFSPDEAAERQLPVWLIARECWKRPELRAIAQRLSARAVEAARLQADKKYLWGVLNEGATLAWDAGDKATAEAGWSETLSLILARPGAGSSSPPATEKDKPPTIPPCTTFQFRQAVELAKSAADKELQDLSFKAIEMALQGGPPVDGENQDQDSMTGYSSTVTFTVGGRTMSTWQDNAAEKNDSTVVKALWILQRQWTKQKAPAERTYELLKSIVMPNARPDEILLYAEPLPETENPQPRSLGILLAKQAVLANRMDDLRQAIAARSKLPAAEFSSQLMLAMVALESKDVSQLKSSLAGLLRSAESKPDRQACELIYQVALPALDKDSKDGKGENAEVATIAMELLVKVTKLLTSSQKSAVSERHKQLLLRLARLQFQKAKPEVGKELLNDYQKTLEFADRGYPAEYRQYLRKLAMQKVASELARANLLDDAMQKLGEAADLQKIIVGSNAPNVEVYGDANDAASTTFVEKKLTAKPAAERYEILKKWTLPTMSRKTLRMMSGFGPATGAGASLLQGLVQIGGANKPKTSVPSSAKLLIQFAKDANQLDDLAASIEPLVEQKLDLADEVLQQIRKAQKKAAVKVP
ncbi:MAG: tetratricopeptide repeat protein [Planctomycetaceae bacterium]|nr:tetratricopeptide repeat protein [Planctomycetaceae bacterium]